MVKHYLQYSIGLETREVFMTLYLDSQHRLIKAEPLFYGTIDASTSDCLVNGRCE